MNFPKFKFSPPNSNFVTDNKHCQLFPFKWHSHVIFLRRCSLTFVLITGLAVSDVTSTWCLRKHWFCYQRVDSKKNANA